MALIYYPDRIYKKTPALADVQRTQRNIKLEKGQADTTTVALDTVISADNDWKVNSIKFDFSNTTARDYAVKVIGGRKVVENINDSLWFIVTGTLWQKITLNSGFYTGTELATELETQLDAQTAFSDKGKTFTVAYSTSTGLFTITPSSGELKYIDKNNTQQLSDRQSIAGHLFGLTTDQAFASAITSDTACFGLNNEASIINETGSTIVEHYHDDIHTLSVDQALHITSSIAATTISYAIAYEEIN